jgi:hypothetical protein
MVLLISASHIVMVTDMSPAHISTFIASSIACTCDNLRGMTPIDLGMLGAQVEELLAPELNVEFCFFQRLLFIRFFATIHRDLNINLLVGVILTTGGCYVSVEYKLCLCGLHRILLKIRCMKLIRNFRGMSLFLSMLMTDMANQSYYSLLLNADWV